MLDIGRIGMDRTSTKYGSMDIVNKLLIIYPLHAIGCVDCRRVPCRFIARGDIPAGILLSCWLIDCKFHLCSCLHSIIIIIPALLEYICLVGDI
ncbi:MAG: hypothetical protein ACTSUE_00600 [Promethearchaeota archaeon]